MSELYNESGYIPSELDPQGLELYESYESAWDEKYDQDKQPQIVTWSSFSSEVDERANKWNELRDNGYLPLWWYLARIQNIPLWISNQSNWGSCAGWSTGGGYMTSLLLQTFLGGYEFTQINPSAAWLVSKSWSTSGGQSMPKIMATCNQDGNWPTRIVGTHPTQVSQSSVTSSISVAKQHQIGACRLPGKGKSLVDIVIRCLEAGLVIPIGTSVKISGASINSDGIKELQLGGSWMHAMLLDSIVKHNNKTYIGLLNSHGDNRYPGTDRFKKPNSGGWLTVDKCVQLLSGSFCDCFVITHSESKINQDRSLAPIPVYIDHL